MDDEFGMFAPDSKTPWAQPRDAVATLDEILYGEALRLQIRESYLKRRGPPPCVWTADAD